MLQLDFLNIHKSFGSKSVLKDCSFSVQSGLALGLLGRNGAGKTTSIRILLDILKPDSGEILLDGQPIDRNKVTFGYLPEERGLYPKKQILPQLVYIGMLKGISRSQATEQAKQLLRRVRLSQVASQKLETLSKGNQQKIQLIVALLGDPQIVILDEPFSGLDPVNAQLLKDLIAEQTQKGKIVIFSSHQMSYVEEFCENIALLNGGSIILSGNLSEIKKTYPRNRLRIDTASPDAYDLLAHSNCVKQVERSDTSYLLTLKDESDRDRLLHEMIKSGLSLERFEIVQPSLEEIFVEKAGDQE